MLWRANGVRDTKTQWEESKMKKKLAGYLVGFFGAALCVGGVVYAATGAKTIDVVYDNIKVYKDNVLCELKDANGTTIEPFIYNGTTYLPVRGAANLADMQVTWDGNTKSVYLWDEQVPEGTPFLEVCPPYDRSGADTYLATNGKSFTMAGEKYSNGLSLWSYSGYALFNLNSQYATIECTIGHTGSEQSEKSVSFIVDGKVVKEVELEPECLPKKVSIPVQYGLQLKIQASGGRYIGIGNMTVK